MPVNECEYHPFLALGEKTNRPSLILGSFPIYSLTQPENELKSQLRHQNGDFKFFYGSRYNKLWQWYKTYLDDTINICSAQSIQDSLNIHEICMSDVINKCYRIEFSANDNDLRGKIWNRNGVNNLINGRTSRVLCTSKQVLKWLNESIIDKHLFTRDFIREQQIQNSLLTGIAITNADYGLAKVYYSQKMRKTVEVIATPTPGGNTYRKLDCFGYDSQVGVTNVEFLEIYLARTFKWLNFRIDF